MTKRDGAAGHQSVELNDQMSTRLIPVSDWHRYHPHPSLAGLRHIRFFCKQNGFEKVFVKLGRRVLIDEKKFFEVVSANNAQVAHIANTKNRISEKRHD